MSWLVTTVLLLTLLMLIGVTLATLRRFVIFPNLECVPGWPADLRPETRALIDAKIDEFAAEGFELALIGHHVARGPHPTSPMALLHKPSTGDLATIHLIADPQRGSLTLDVTSQFSETKYLSVSTSPPAESHFQDDPRVTQFSFSWVTDATTLVEAHRRVISAAGLTDTPRIAFTNERGLLLLNHGWAVFLEQQSKGGLVQFDAAADLYRPTWKGIFRIALSMLLPGHQSAAQCKDAEERKVWKQLGMDQWTTQRPVPPAPTPIPEALRSAPRDEPIVREGEFQVEKSASETIVRIGASELAPGPARGCLGVVIFTFLGTIVFGAAVAVLRINSRFPGNPREFAAVGFIAFGVLMLAMAIWPDWRRVLAQGPIPAATVVIRASHSGLTRQMPVGFPPFVSMTRHDIVEISVVEKGDVTQKKYALLLHRRSPRRPMLLCICRSRDPLEAARRELTEALGPQIGLLEHFGN